MEGREEQELAAVLGIGRVDGSKQVQPSLEEVAEVMDKIKHFRHLEVHQMPMKNVKIELKSAIRTDEQTVEGKCKKVKTILDKSINDRYLKEEAVREYECTICENTFDTKKRLKYHKDSKHRKSLTRKAERALCNICSKTFSSKYILERHTKTRHEFKSESDAMECNVCSKTFSNKYLAKYHMRMHDAGTEENVEIVTCTQCSKTFSNKYMLKAHMKKHDPNYKIDRVLCSECSKSFSTKGVLKRHIRSEHGGQKFTPCSICGLSFTLNSISKHVNRCKLPENEREEIREKKKVECSDCGRVLADKVKLKRHIRFVHNQEKLFECKYCDHKDFRTDNIKVHIKNNHHGQNPNDSFSRITPVVEFLQ